MVNKERLEQLSSPVIEIYNAMEADMLENIAKRLADDKSLLDSNVTEWQFQKLNQLNGLNNENLRLVARQSGVSEREIKEALRKAGFEGIEGNEEYMEEALKNGVDLTQPPPLAEDNAILDILRAYQDQAEDTLNLVNSTILDSSEQAYRNIVNRSVAESLTGVKSSEQTIRDSVRALSREGLPALRKNGRNYSPEGYVRMLTRTLSNNVTNEMQEQRFEEWGCNLVEVSSHAGARPKCAPYQGKIYSRSGGNSRFPNLGSTSWGEPDGLFGINCHHVKYPYFPGYSKKRYQPVSQKKNDRAYENSQKQRKIERDIRKAKTEKRMMEAAKDEVGIAAANQKIRDKQEQMRNFIKETGRTRRRANEQLY